MNEKTYSIALADGTVLDGLRLNGDNFISSAEIPPETFSGNLSPVIINDEIHENMALVQISIIGGEYWFVLRDMSAAELDRLKMQSDIEYVAMMAGVEL